MSIDLFRMLDSFLPASLLCSGDQTRLMKGRVLAFLSLIYLVSLGSLIVIFTILGLLGIFSLWGAVLTSSLSCGLYAYQLWYFKHGGDAERAANIGMFTMVTATSACVFFTGGWTSPVMMILLCMPTCAFLMEGKKTGLSWSAVVAIIGVFFLILHIQAITLPNLIDAALQDYLAYSSWLYGFMIIASGMAFYGNLTRTINQAANAERQRSKTRATYDSLTGAFSRQAFQQQLPHWLEDCQKSGRQLLFVEMDLEVAHSLHREQLEELLVRCTNTLQSLFDKKLLLSRNSGTCFQALLPDVGDNSSARTMLDTLHSKLMALCVADKIQINMGAVMVPGYTENRALMLKTARKAIQDARMQKTAWILFTEAERPDARHRDSVQLTRYCYNEIIKPA